MSDDSEYTESTNSTPSIFQKRLQRQLDEPVFSNQAVARCVEAYERVSREWMSLFTREVVDDGEPEDGDDTEKPDMADPDPDPDDGEDEEEGSIPDAELRAAAKLSQVATKMACEAYRAALPPLTGEANIRDFIACVAQGMAIGVFAPNEVSKLFYGAQVAALAESKRYTHRQVV